MKQFFCGLLAGAGIGMMVGAALVQVPGDQGGPRNLSIAIPLILTVTGVVGAGIGYRGLSPNKPQESPG